jgi:hypothetical protein
MGNNTTTSKSGSHTAPRWPPAPKDGFLLAPMEHTKRPPESSRRPKGTREELHGQNASPQPPPYPTSQSPSPRRDMLLG